MDANDRRALAARAAADWWVCLQSTALPHAQREQFVDWLRESPVHVAEMLRVARVHGALERFQRWAQVAGGETMCDEGVVALPLPPTVIRDAEVGRRPVRRMRPGLIAATLAAAAVAVALALPYFGGQVIDTDRGERREVVLGDGSVLQVDPQTRLHVRMGELTREVLLTRGRALFRVAADPARPFVVRADATMIRAVGTAFGVERQHRGVVVTVVEGRVAVSNPGSSGLLDANQQLTVHASGTAAPVREVDSQRELAWAQGRLIFDGDPVARVVEEFNRYNRVQLQVSDTALARRPVSGVFSATDPQSFIAFIQTVAPVSVVREGGRVVILAPVRP